MMKTISSFAERVQNLASPALFAQFVSRGKWQPARHLMEIDRAIVSTLTQRSPRILVIEAPPRHGKSELVSRYLPAWFLGVNPTKQVMLAGYEAGFARTWGRRARELLEEWGEACFDLKVKDDVRAANDWGIDGFGGGMLTAGAGGPMTGRGADLLIIDDPIKNAEEAMSETLRDKLWDWWMSTAYTRLEPTGCAIVIATRWHNEDLSGRLIAQGETSGEVRRLHLPAFADGLDSLRRPLGTPLWPERWPAEKLEKRRSGLSEWWFQAMYQQNPGRGLHVAWPAEYFGPSIWTPTWPTTFDQAIVSCDLATGQEQGDYSAAVFVGRVKNEYWVDAMIGRRPTEQFLAEVLLFAARMGTDRILVEKNLFYQLVRGELERQIMSAGLGSFDLNFVGNQTPKRIRLMRLGFLMAGGRFHFRRSAGTELLIRQLEEFPLGRHDDGPDALEMGVRGVYPANEIGLFLGDFRHSGWSDENLT